MPLTIAAAALSGLGAVLLYVAHVYFDQGSVLVDIERSGSSVVHATGVSDTPASLPRGGPEGNLDAEASPATTGGLSFHACAKRVDELAAGTMSAVIHYDAVTRWASRDSGKRLVSVLIGQRYPSGGGIPNGATTVVAAPDAAGRCDAMAIQVVPSPLPCAKLRETLAASGQQIGDLAGIPLIENANGQTMLIASASGTCVLVALKPLYSE